MKNCETADFIIAYIGYDNNSKSRVVDFYRFEDGLLIRHSLFR